MPITLPDFKVVWKYPTPRGAKITKTQQDFEREYFPTGHKIFDPLYYPDIVTVVEKVIINPQTGEKTTTQDYETHQVNRCSVTYQKDAVTILMAHLFGNKIAFSDISRERNSEIAKNRLIRYKEVVNIKNYDTFVHDFVEQGFIYGHSAIMFYLGQDGTTRSKVLSYGYGDELYCSYDINGNQERLYRRYKPTITDANGMVKEVVLIDVIDKNGIRTYDSNGEKYQLAEDGINPTAGLPFVYYKRPEGAIWTAPQSMIDNHELMLSRLSEDNRTKAKSKLVITGIDTKTLSNGKKQSNYQAKKIGEMDVFIGGADVDVKMVQGASLSEAFKFEFESGRENIFNAMGIVYPKQKSSGDMPTGSMKMMFFPTERKCMELIHEYNKILDDINKVFKLFVTIEYPEERFEQLSVMASLRLFTPQDDTAKASIINQGMASGALADEIGRTEYPYASVDNPELCRKQEKTEMVSSTPNQDN